MRSWFGIRVVIQLNSQSRGFVLDTRCRDRDGNHGNGRQYSKAYSMVGNDVPWDYMAHVFYHPDLKKELPGLRKGKLRQLNEEEKKACLPKLS